jgi:hypothetical protein
MNNSLSSLGIYQGALGATLQTELKVNLFFFFNFLLTFTGHNRNSSVVDFSDMKRR